MKKIFTSIMMAVLPLFVASTYAADITTPLFATFEAGTAVPFVLNADGPGSEIRTQVISDNPVKEENITNKCIKVEKPASYEWYFKTFLKLEDGTVVKQASVNHKYLHFFVKYPEGSNGLEVAVFKTGDFTTPIYQAQIDYANTNGWHDVVIDLTDKITADGIGGIWIRPFYGSNTTMYVDEFELTDNANPRSITNVNTPLFGTFDDGNTYPFILNAEGENANMKNQVVADNPLKTDNVSAKAIRMDVPEGAEWYFKTYFKIQDYTAIIPASVDHKYLHIFMMSPTNTSGAEIGVYNTTGTLIYQSSSIEWEETSDWHDVVIDLTANLNGKPGITDNNIGGIWIRPFGLSVGKTYYFDEFELSDSAEPRAITEISTPLFGAFDDGNAAPFALNANGPGSDMKTQVIADNILKKDNISEKCIKLTAPAGIQWWHKTYFKVQDKTTVVPASADHKYLHFYMMSPTNTTGVEVGVFNIAGEQIYQTGNIEWDATTDWHDVIIDLTADLNGKPGITDNNIAGIWVRPFSIEDGKVYYFDQFELSDTTIPRIITGVKKNQLDDLMVYSNGDNLYIKGQDIAFVEVFNLSGTTVLAKPIEFGSSILSLEKGIYILKVQKNDGQILIRKIVF